MMLLFMLFGERGCLQCGPVRFPPGWSLVEGFSPGPTVFFPPEN